LVHLAIDTTVTPHRLYRKTASGSTPTLQQVLDAGSTLTSSETITDGGSNFGITFTRTGSSPGLTAVNTSNGNAFFAQNTGTGAAILALSPNTSGSTVSSVNTGGAAGIFAESGDASTNTILYPIWMWRTSTGTAANGIGAGLKYTIEASDGNNYETGTLVNKLTNATVGTRTSQWDLTGLNSASAETFMNIQTGGIVRVNNNADTLATKAYARSVGGGGSAVDTAVANAGSVTANERLYNVIDSLVTQGWGDTYNVNSDLNYQQYWDIAGASSSSTGVLYNAASGTGAAVTRPGTGFDNWFGMVQFGTGTTTTGFCYGHFGNSGVIMDINLNTSYRYNFGTKIRLEDLSDGTETYHLMQGFSDANNNDASTVDGVWFSYTHSASSGAFVCNTRSNSVSSTTASGVTVAADTDYELEISVFGGSAYFYINKALVATIATNVPSGTTRATSIATAIRKSAGTTSRNMYIEWLAYGKKNN
jgi:hypothetical protein